jgi:hypothetical protein
MNSVQSKTEEVLHAFEDLRNDYSAVEKRRRKLVPYAHLLQNTMSILNKELQKIANTYEEKKTEVHQYLCNLSLHELSQELNFLESHVRQQIPNQYYSFIDFKRGMLLETSIVVRIRMLQCMIDKLFGSIGDEAS